LWQPFGASSSGECLQGNASPAQPHFITTLAQRNEVEARVLDVVADWASLYTASEIESLARKTAKLLRRMAAMGVDND
jgi:hypothetical protein